MSTLSSKLVNNFPKTSSPFVRNFRGYDQPRYFDGKFDSGDSSQEPDFYPPRYGYGDYHYRFARLLHLNSVIKLKINLHSENTMRTTNLLNRFHREANGRLMRTPKNFVKSELISLIRKRRWTRKAIGCMWYSKLVQQRSWSEQKSARKALITFETKRKAHTRLSRSTQCSNLCQLPNNYVSRCEQKYVQKRLIALDASGERLYSDTFWFPSCCACTLSVASKWIKRVRSFFLLENV